MSKSHTSPSLPVTIRAALAQDAGAVEAVLLASYPSLMSDDYDAVLLAQALPRMTKANPKLLGSGTYLIAEAGGRAVACGGWSLAAAGASRSEPGVAHIRHFATAEDWAGRGLGRLIYERCAIQACAAGVRTFECYSSINGEAFYSALGFRRIGSIAVPLGESLYFPSIHMTRSI